MAKQTTDHMIAVTLVPNERWVGTRCPNCHSPYRSGDKVFESVDQKVAIHVSCVVALALIASLENADAGA
jgi:hypothetical protein